MLADRIIFVCIIVFAGVYFYATAQIPSLEIGDPLGPKAFPRLLGIGLLITAGMLFIEMMKARRMTAEMESDKEAEAAEFGHVKVIVGVVIWTALYYAVFEHLGFIIATAVFLLGLTSYFHRGHWLTNVLTSVLFAVGAYALFVKALGVTLAPGILSF